MYRAEAARGYSYYKTYYKTLFCAILFYVTFMLVVS